MLAAKVWAAQDYKAFDLGVQLVECIADLTLSIYTGYCSALMQMATNSGDVLNAIFRPPMHQLMTAQIRVHKTE